MDSRSREMTTPDASEWRSRRFVEPVSAQANFVVREAKAAVKTSVPRSPRSRKAGRGERPPASSVPLSSGRPYCYAHGYDGHSSADCYKMRYGLAAKDFTDAARMATTHTSVSGGSVTRL